MNTVSLWAYNQSINQSSIASVYSEVERNGKNDYKQYSEITYDQNEMPKRKSESIQTKLVGICHEILKIPFDENNINFDFIKKTLQEFYTDDFLGFMDDIKDHQHPTRKQNAKIEVLLLYLCMIDQDLLRKQLAIITNMSIINQSKILWIMKQFSLVVDDCTLADEFWGKFFKLSKRNYFHQIIKEQEFDPNGIIEFLTNFYDNCSIELTSSKNSGLFPQCRNYSNMYVNKSSSDSEMNFSDEKSDHHSEKFITNGNNNYLNISKKSIACYFDTMEKKTEILEKVQNKENILDENRNHQNNLTKNSKIVMRNDINLLDQNDHSKSDIYQSILVNCIEAQKDDGNITKGVDDGHTNNHNNIQSINANNNSSRNATKIESTNSGDQSENIDLNISKHFDELNISRNTNIENSDFIPKLDELDSTLKVDGQIVSPEVSESDNNEAQNNNDLSSTAKIEKNHEKINLNVEIIGKPQNYSSIFNENDETVHLTAKEIGYQAIKNENMKKEINTIDRVNRNENIKVVNKNEIEKEEKINSQSLENKKIGHLQKQKNRAESEDAKIKETEIKYDQKNDSPLKNNSNIMNKTEKTLIPKNIIDVGDRVKNTTKNYQNKEKAPTKLNEWNKNDPCNMVQYISEIHACFNQRQINNNVTAETHKSDCLKKQENVRYNQKKIIQDSPINQNENCIHAVKRINALTKNKYVQSRGSSRPNHTSEGMKQSKNRYISDRYVSQKDTKLDYSTKETHSDELIPDVPREKIYDFYQIVFGGNFMKLPNTFRFYDRIRRCDKRNVQNRKWASDEIRKLFSTNFRKFKMECSSIYSDEYLDLIYPLKFIFNHFENLVKLNEFYNHNEYGERVNLECLFDEFVFHIKYILTKIDQISEKSNCLRTELIISRDFNRKILNICEIYKEREKILVGKVRKLEKNQEHIQSLNALRNVDNHFILSCMSDYQQLYDNHKELIDRSNMNLQVLSSIKHMLSTKDTNEQSNFDSQNGTQLEIVDIIESNFDLPSNKISQKFTKPNNYKNKLKNSDQSIINIPSQRIERNDCNQSQKSDHNISDESKDNHDAKLGGKMNNCINSYINEPFYMFDSYSPPNGIQNTTNYFYSAPLCHENSYLNCGMQKNYYQDIRYNTHANLAHTSMNNVLPNTINKFNIHDMWSDTSKINGNQIDDKYFMDLDYDINGTPQSGKPIYVLDSSESSVRILENIEKDSNPTIEFISYRATSDCDKKLQNFLKVLDGISDTCLKDISHHSIQGSTDCDDPIIEIITQNSISNYKCNTITDNVDDFNNTNNATDHINCNSYDTHIDSELLKINDQNENNVINSKSKKMSENENHASIDSNENLNYNLDISKNKDLPTKFFSANNNYTSHENYLDDSSQTININDAFSLKNDNDESVPSIKENKNAYIILSNCDEENANFDSDEKIHSSKNEISEINELECNDKKSDMIVRSDISLSENPLILSNERLNCRQNEMISDISSAHNLLEASSFQINNVYDESGEEKFAVDLPEVTEDQNTKDSSYTDIYNYICSKVLEIHNDEYVPTILDQQSFSSNRLDDQQSSKIELNNSGEKVHKENKIDEIFGNSLDHTNKIKTQYSVNETFDTQKNKNKFNLIESSNHVEFGEFDHVVENLNSLNLDKIFAITKYSDSFFNDSADIEKIVESTQIIERNLSSHYSEYSKKSCNNYCSEEKIGIEERKSCCNSSESHNVTDSEISFDTFEKVYENLCNYQESKKCMNIARDLDENHIDDIITVGPFIQDERYLETKSNYSIINENMDEDMSTNDIIYLDSSFDERKNEVITNPEKNILNNNKSNSDGVYTKYNFTNKIVEKDNPSNDSNRHSEKENCVDQEFISDDIPQNSLQQNENFNNIILYDVNSDYSNGYIMIDRPNMDLQLKIMENDVHPKNYSDFFGQRIYQYHNQSTLKNVHDFYFRENSGFDSLGIAKLIMNQFYPIVFRKYMRKEPIVKSIDKTNKIIELNTIHENENSIIHKSAKYDNENENRGDIECIDEFSVMKSPMTEELFESSCTQIACENNENEKSSLSASKYKNTIDNRMKILNEEYEPPRACDILCDQSNDTTRTNSIVDDRLEEDSNDDLDKCSGIKRPNILDIEERVSIINKVDNNINFEEKIAKAKVERNSLKKENEIREDEKNKYIQSSGDGIDKDHSNKKDQNHLFFYDHYKCIQEYENLVFYLLKNGRSLSYTIDRMNHLKAIFIQNYIKTIEDINQRVIQFSVHQMYFDNFLIHIDKTIKSNDLPGLLKVLNDSMEKDIHLDVQGYDAIMTDKIRNTIIEKISLKNVSSLHEDEIKELTDDKNIENGYNSSSSINDIPSETSFLEKEQKENIKIDECDQEYNLSMNDSNNGEIEIEKNDLRVKDQIILPEDQSQRENTITKMNDTNIPNDICSNSPVSTKIRVEDYNTSYNEDKNSMNNKDFYNFLSEKKKNQLQDDYIEKNHENSINGENFEKRSNIKNETTHTSNSINLKSINKENMEECKIQNIHADSSTSLCEVTSVTTGELESSSQSNYKENFKILLSTLLDVQKRYKSLKSKMKKMG